MSTEVSLDELEAALAAIETKKPATVVHVDPHPTVEIPREVVTAAAEAIEKIAEQGVAPVEAKVEVAVTEKPIQLQAVLRPVKPAHLPEPAVAEPEASVPAEQPKLEVEAPKRTNSLVLKDYVNPDEVKRDVSIDMSDLDNETCRQSATYLHHAQNASLARAQAKRIKTQAEIAESRLYAIHREALAKAGGKTTEAMVDAAVKGDARYAAMKQKVIDAELIADLGRDAAFAMEQRKDMLVQLTADRRKEREGELRMTAATAGRDAVVAGIAARSA